MHLRQIIRRLCDLIGVMHKSIAPLALLLVAGLCIGVVNPILFGAPSAPPLWSTLEKLALVVLVYWWFHADTAEQNYQPSWLLRGGIIFLAIVAVPVYLVRSRGGRQGGVALLKMFAFLMLWFALVVAGIKVSEVFHA